MVHIVKEINISIVKNVINIFEMIYKINKKKLYI